MMSLLSEASRYLTPRRICVAAAASSAAGGRRPGRKALPVLRELVRPTSGPSSPRTFRDLLSALEQIPLLEPGVVEHDYDRGSSEEEDTMDMSIADYMLESVADIDSVDALQSLADTFVPPDDHSATLLHDVYAYDGPIACFLRKVSVMYAALPFEAAVDLLSALSDFVSGNEGAECGDDASGVIAFFPEIDADDAAFTLSRGAPIADDAAFAELVRPVTPASSPSIDFANHLEALRRRDYSGSLDTLHRYYDLSLGAISGSLSNNFAVEAKESSVTDPEDARGHQYAALSLAAVHFHFGHPRRAIAALDDAVRAAQQCGDDACQARALSWIARTSASPEQRHQLLRHARDPLALAREELQTVVTPYAKQAHINVQPTPGDSFWRHEQRHQAALSAARMQRIHSRVGFDTANLSVDSLLVSAAAWESHAALPTAVAVACMALKLSRRRGHLRHTRGKDGAAMSANEARAMVAFASLEAKSGRSDEAIASLSDYETVRILKPDFAADQSSSRPERELLRRCATWLQFEAALRRGEVSVADRLCDVLATYDGDLVGGPDAELDAIEARCRWHLVSRQYCEAAAAAERLSRRAAALTRPVRVVEGLRLSAQAHIEAGTSNTGLPAALSAVSLARGLGLEAALVQSVLTLTDVMLQMDGGGSGESAAAAMRTLDQVLPRALEGLGMRERGRARRLQAECLLANGVGEYGAVVNTLMDAVEAFATVEDRVGLRDCYYMLARVQNEAGNNLERKHASKLFREQVKALECAQFTVNE
jgi:Anaphase-promoting complex subunit 5